MDFQLRLHVFTATLCTLVAGLGDQAARPAYCADQDAVTAPVGVPRLLPRSLRCAVEDTELSAPVTGSVTEARTNVARMTSSLAVEPQPRSGPATGLSRLPAVESTVVELAPPRTIPLFQPGQSAQAGRLSSGSYVAEKRRRGGPELQPPPPRLGEGLDESLTPERVLPRKSPFESPRLERLPPAPDDQVQDLGRRFDRDLPIWKPERLTRLPEVEEPATVAVPLEPRTADVRIAVRTTTPATDDRAPMSALHLNPGLTSRVDAIARKGLSLTLRGALFRRAPNSSRLCD